MYTLAELPLCIGVNDWKITAANIVRVTFASRENWASVANYVKCIPKLKERDLEAEEYVGTPA